ncbi:SdpI family protein [Rhodoflexus caldus]|uniref:SdpI family protein n=1 Tax=Rhodoflexus caldus TaxID=2891236 RepID=UPI00202A78FE|nr:SdpI family protein [Rhodoflexus caldus]
MKLNRTDLLATLLIIAPLAYGLWLYPQLPNPMPVHFGLNGEADGFAPKSLFYIFLLPCLNAGGYFFTKLLVQLDPKTAKRKGNISVHLDKILLSVALLLSIISFFVFQSMVNGSIALGAGRLIPIALALFISVIGNYMNNIRPNYFVGFRTPWTLENEEVWRKTHQLGAKIWFWGGIASAIIATFSTLPIGIAIVITFIVTSAIFIMYYSYSIYPK